MSDPSRHPPSDAQRAKEAAERARNEFLSRVSHELRTPLNGIVGFAQLLQQRESELPAWSAAAIEQIQRAGEHLRLLVDDLLDLAAVEAGRLELSIAAVALDEVVREALAASAPLAAQHGVRLLPSAPSGLVVRCDRARLAQVLLNLLSNAVRFNRSGGEVRLQAHDDAAHDGVRLDIADTGVGITETQQLTLFDPFDRPGTDGAGESGSGLGLAVSRRLVQAMGGRIELRSTAGSGTCVSVWLPAAAAAPACAEPAPGAGEGLRVLYVEDNPINVMLMREALALHGPRFELHVACDGEQGLEMLSAVRPRVVLLDINLPGISGHQVLLSMRADARFARLPCVAVSADAMPDEIERAREHGFDDYWTKPLDIARLAERITLAAGLRGGPAS